MGKEAALLKLNILVLPVRIFCKMTVKYSIKNLQYIKIFFNLALRPNTGHGLLILEVFSRSHTMTHHSR